MKKILIIGAVMIISLLSLTACSTEQADRTPFPGGKMSVEQSCLASGGTLLEEYRECVGISAEECVRIGGTLDECASACRHDTNADLCTRQCVVVCTY